MYTPQVGVSSESDEGTPLQLVAQVFSAMGGSPVFEDRDQCIHCTMTFGPVEYSASVMWFEEEGALSFLCPFTSSGEAMSFASLAEFVALANGHIFNGYLGICDGVVEYRYMLSLADSDPTLSQIEYVLEQMIHEVTRFAPVVDLLCRGETTVLQAIEFATMRVMGEA